MQKNNVKGKSLSIIIILLMLFGVFSMDYSVYAASHDNVITNIKMTKISGETLEPVGMWDTVKVNAKFSLPNNTVHEGDTTTIQLPDQLTFISDTAFDVKDAGGNVVAKATIDSSTKKITLTYTNYPETHSNVTG